MNGLKKQDNDDNKFKEESKIYEVLQKLENNVSQEFLDIFKEKDELTVNKTSDIFEYFLKLIVKNVREEIQEYQEDLEEKELKNKKNKLEEYYEKEASIISKDEFETAIRLFMTLVLFREEDKENKIKSNRKNILNYLKAEDLWDKNKYRDEKFNENLNQLKNINIQINHILCLVDIKDEDTSDIKKYIKNKEKPIEKTIKSDDEDDEDKDRSSHKSGSNNSSKSGSRSSSISSSSYQS